MVTFNAEVRATNSPSRIFVQRLTEQDRTLIEALLTDRGILAGLYGDADADAHAHSDADPHADADTDAHRAGGVDTVIVNPIVRLALTTVSPGDLITADFMNNIIEALLALDQRVAELEGNKPAPADAHPDSHADAHTDALGRLADAHAHAHAYADPHAHAYADADAAACITPGADAGTLQSRSRPSSSAVSDDREGVGVRSRSSATISAKAWSRRSWWGGR